MLNQKYHLSDGIKSKRLQVVEKNYQNNIVTDYTEKIKKLDQDFNYGHNSNHYWTEPEQSLFYGTPLYEVASSSQKLALNHLWWGMMYSYVSYSEAETIDYNQITGDCFSAMGGKYKMIADLLEHESEQERVHIHAFWKVNYQTIKALMGKEAFRKTSRQKLSQEPKAFKYMYQSLLLIAKIMLNRQESFYSPYFSKLEKESKFDRAKTRGFFHGTGNIPSPWLRFFAFNWGSSPFLACQYYTVRYIANMLLKNQEHSMSVYFRKINKQGQFIPAPTAISYYHFLDESFHTTTSLFLGRDVYKNLPKPTTSEKIIINLAVYLAQLLNLQGISGVKRGGFWGDDISGMNETYKIFRSRLFNMSSQEALHWLEKCYCQEHEGFHQSLSCHQRLLSDARKFCSQLDYLWPVNREMRLMAAGSSIEKTIQKNIKTFKLFSKSVALEK
ncbi:MAG: hypothetical protein F6K47_09830 [Symploca sp. SIO2E6]|nr:hypothetical protein [Symploca sp. SIO2E6]